MLGLARHSAGVAADTHILIYDEAVPQQELQTVAGVTGAFLVEPAGRGQSGLHQDEVELGVFLELFLQRVAHVVGPGWDVGEGTSIGSDQLERLATLRDQGILTDEEFEAKKKQLLDL